MLASFWKCLRNFGALSLSYLKSDPRRSKFCPIIKYIFKTQHACSFKPLDCVTLTVSCVRIKWFRCLSYVCSKITPGKLIRVETKRIQIAFSQKHLDTLPLYNLGEIYQIFPLVACLQYPKGNVPHPLHPGDVWKVCVCFASLNSTSIPCFLRYMTVALSSNMSSAQLMVLLEAASLDTSPVL